MLKTKWQSSATVSSAFNPGDISQELPLIIENLVAFILHDVPMLPDGIIFFLRIVIFDV